MAKKSSKQNVEVIHRKKNTKSKKMDVFYFIVRNVIPTQIKIVKFKSKCQFSGVNKDLKIQSSCYRLLHPHCKMLQSELEVFMEYVAVSVSVSVFICSLTAPG